MSTPAAIGVYTATATEPPSRVRERSWQGVYHHWGGAPEDLGNTLLRTIADHGGDLRRVVETTIAAAMPGGWSSLEDGERIDDPDDTGPISSSGELDHVAYVYVIDVQHRRLDVFATDADSDDERLASVRFDAHGRADPSRFEREREPCELIEPTPGIDGEGELVWKCRAAFATAAASVSAGESLSEGLVRDVFARAIEVALEDDESRETQRSPFVAIFDIDDEPSCVVRRVEVGQAVLHYPEGIPCNGLPCVDVQGGWSCLEPQWSHFVKAADADGVDHDSVGAALTAGIVGVHEVVHPDDKFDVTFDHDDISVVRCRTVVGTQARTGREISMNELTQHGIDAGDVDEGDELLFPVNDEECDWLGALLSWLRVGRV